MDRVEDLRVARELSGDVDDAEISPKKNDLGSYGWELIRDSFEASEKEKSVHESDTIEAETEETVEFVAPAPVQSALSKVRALLDLW